MDIASFKRIVLEAARQVSGTVSEIRAPDVTPNFVSACVETRSYRVHVLMSHAGDWAFSNFRDTWTCRLDFTDCPEIYRALEEMFEIVPLSVAELTGPFQPREWMTDVDIAYWKPQTLGEALFNWWD